ncbi:MAG TPA: hypothetical protein VJX67_21230, partial [Blastocatellia bacterium]|nr:hypothetical protein [Blastocatellia bacterium]
SFSVIDVATGKPVSLTRFSAAPAAIDYVSQAKLMCSVCGAAFNSKSIQRIVKKGNGWEIQFPHDCEMTAAS